MVLNVHRKHKAYQLGMGWERNSEWLDRALRPGKTKQAVDHRQNNSYVKAVGTSPLHSN